MSGQSVDAALVSARKQRNTGAGEGSNQGRQISQTDRAEPSQQGGAEGSRCPLDLESRRQGRSSLNGTPPPIFGDQSHISIDRRFGFIGKAKVTSASEAGGRQLRHVSDTDNTAADVWSDSAYRWQHNG